MTSEEIELRFRLVDAKIALANNYIEGLAAYLNMVIRQMTQVDRGLALACLSIMSDNSNGAVEQIEEVRESLLTVAKDLAEMMSHFEHVGGGNAEG